MLQHDKLQKAETNKKLMKTAEQKVKEVSNLERTKLFLSAEK
jgi:hypothetical protein